MASALPPGFCPAQSIFSRLLIDMIDDQHADLNIPDLRQLQTELLLNRGKNIRSHIRRIRSRLRAARLRHSHNSDAIARPEAEAR